MSGGCRARNGQMLEFVPFARYDVARRRSLKLTGVHFNRKQYRAEERKKILADIGFWAAKVKGFTQAPESPSIRSRIEAGVKLVDGLVEKFLAMGGMIGAARAQISEARPIKPPPPTKIIATNSTEPTPS